MAHFDTSPEGRMNFREIAEEVRERSGNRTKPSDIQIVNAIGQNAYRPHSLVPESLYRLSWDESNSLSIEDAEIWMKHLVVHFAALQAEWDDRKAQKYSRKGFEEGRLKHMKAVGYEAFKAEFEALHEERRTRQDVDGWLLKREKDNASDYPVPQRPSEAPQRREPPILEPIPVRETTKPPVASQDEILREAEKTYTGHRRGDGTPWLRPFRKHSGVASFSGKKRRELWPNGIDR